MKYTLGVCMLTLALTGCATQSFVLNNNENEIAARNDHFFSENIFDMHEDANKLTTHHFFISGIGQGQAINPAKVCGTVSRVAKVETETTFVNAVLGIITLGIYTPREARVYCK
jgi:hypothetical protein|tara:strand:+ start:193 stop:534 length:342 start_codon:yes stop_codon:yes gene_type:complete